MKGGYKIVSGNGKNLGALYESPAGAETATVGTVFQASQERVKTESPLSVRPISPSAPHTPVIQERLWMARLQRP